MNLLILVDSNTQMRWVLNKVLREGTQARLSRLMIRTMSGILALKNRLAAIPLLSGMPQAPTGLTVD